MCRMQALPTHIANALDLAKRMLDARNRRRQGWHLFLLRYHWGFSEEGAGLMEVCEGQGG